MAPHRVCRLLGSIALGSIVVGAGALDNGVGRIPAMGWNSWNTFRCDINEQLVLEVWE